MRSTIVTVCTTIKPTATKHTRQFVRKKKFLVNIELIMGEPLNRNSDHSFHWHGKLDGDRG